jgi:uncharacterized protein (DUF2147 family)
VVRALRRGLLHPKQMMHLFRLVSVFLVLSMVPAAHAAHGVFGDWKTPSGSVIRVDHCGGDVCLQVVQLPSHAPATTDINNPDASQRQRPLCGLTVGSGFHQDDDVHLSGGHLYDPKSGNDYKGTITAEGDTLRLRGYIGIPLFGRSETWKRIAPVPGCRHL